MNAVEYIRNTVFTAAFPLLPSKMDSPEARAMLIAIGWQESKLTHRVQIGGPAHGFWQFERSGGVRGVLTHAASSGYIRQVLSAQSYDWTEQTSYDAIVHNDILAACYARLLLWTLPSALPKHGDYDGSWGQYISAWRPGKPHRDTWNAHFDAAWM